jgi:hydrogenase maturation protease
MSAARIIGLGQPYAGDDGVGAAVIEHLRGRCHLELHTAHSPTELIDLLVHEAPVVVIDALVGRDPGEVQEVELAEVAGSSGFSSHGLGLREAVDLARVILPVTSQLHVVAVTISPPARHQRGLSPAVAAAVPHAAALALALCG